MVDGEDEAQAPGTLSIYLSIYLSSVQFFYRSIFSFTIYLTIYLSVNYSTNPSIDFSFTIYLSICNLQHQQINIIFAYESFLIIIITGLLSFWHSTIYLNIYQLPAYHSIFLLIIYYLSIWHSTIYLSVYLALAFSYLLIFLLSIYLSYTFYLSVYKTFN